MSSWQAAGVQLSVSPDVVVVGAGIVGASCAYHLAKRGVRVLVVDRGSVVSGTTGAGEGNILVSDKEPGPELDLALYSRTRWDGLDAEVGGFALEAKGGVVVVSEASALAGLHETAARQGGAGVRSERLDPDGLHEAEPHLARDLPGGVRYPQDAQVDPMRAAARLLEAARGFGAVLRTGVEVLAIRVLDGRVATVVTDDGHVGTGAVVNAAGTWGGEVAARAGVTLPVLPRKGLILVTEPLPPTVVRHKVYDADYLANVASGEEGLQTSAVIESTPGGTVLIGASRERVGFDRRVELAVTGRLAAQAVRLFPVLAGVRAQRAYVGFRPYCPDHLPVIGPDPRVEGLFHACGHEGAGIGLAPATGALLAQAYAGDPPDLDLTPFSPARFLSQDQVT